MAEKQTEPEAVDMSTVKPKKIEPIVEQPTDVSKPKSGAKKRKKSLSQSFGDIFLSSDANSVGQYVVFEVLIPGAKDIIVDMLKKGIDMAFFGKGSAPSGVSRSKNGTSHVSYTSYYDKNDRGRREGRYDRKAAHDFRDILWDHKIEAEEVLSSMMDILDQHDVVSIADLNQLAEVEGNYTDNNWGWETLRGARVMHDREGYYLDLPKPIAL